ncbi:reverse transcriptase domain-containing protein [Tanacetum coccineum]|uniref:Reverse transcriptase domain-containing protein n=1 Tax=Tanacetum coccineum TaxID=301880 RepID=A0ABQ5J5K3_9ASTR
MGSALPRLALKPSHGEEARWQLEDISWNLEVYVDDLVIKSYTEHEILRDIEETFHNLRRINMKLNPKKCTFSAEEGAFLGHMVSMQGIKACPEKVEAVMKLQSPQTLKEASGKGVPKHEEVYSGTANGNRTKTQRRANNVSLRGQGSSKRNPIGEKGLVVHLKTLQAQAQESIHFGRRIQEKKDF